MVQHLFRIAQEAVSNAVRHARATRINVELLGAEGTINLQVEDYGDGLPAVLPSVGIGLHTMAFRTHLLEGEFTITPTPGGGTRVCCMVPGGSLSPTNDEPIPTRDIAHG